MGNRKQVMATGVPPLQEVHWDLDRVFLGFNSSAFFHQILVPDFQGDIKKCAEAVGLPSNYLRDLLYSSTRQAGTKTLTSVYRYCIRTGRRAENFIFRIQDKAPWDEKNDSKLNKGKEKWGKNERQEIFK